MELHPLDGYLLDGTPTKADAIAAALRERSPAPAAQPFYRALERVGARAADEALIALRIVLGGKAPDDGTVVAARTSRSRAQAGEAGAREEYLRTVGTVRP
ncbi:MAG TPA: hypothetical protein VHT53_01310 [Candidatus Elarobacter sp.]|nr:hypothetical protein [Candidatus Elarobacter sp.]